MERGGCSARVHWFLFHCPLFSLMVRPTVSDWPGAEHIGLMIKVRAGGWLVQKSKHRSWLNCVKKRPSLFSYV